jgi:hypothetical protein
MSRKVETERFSQLGVGALSYTVNPKSSSWEVVTILLKFDTAPVTAGNIEIWQKNTVAGANWDTIRYSIDPTGGKSHTAESFTRIGENDTFVIEYANPDARNIYGAVQYDVNPAE